MTLGRPDWSKNISTTLSALSSRACTTVDEKKSQFVTGTVGGHQLTLSYRGVYGLMRTYVCQR